MLPELFPPWDWPRQLAAQAAEGSASRVSVRVGGGLPYLAVRLAMEGRSCAVLAPEERAETWAEDARALAALTDRLADWSIAFVPERSYRDQAALLEQSIQKKGVLWFGAPVALLEKAISKTNFLAARYVLKVGRSESYSALIDFLSNHGYKRVAFVEEPGEFAVRGEIFDVWSSNTDQPARMIFFNDVIESMHLFDPESQRTTAFLAETILLPLVEKKFAAPAPQSSVLDCLERAPIVLADQAMLEDGGDPAWKEALSARPVIAYGLTGAASGLNPAGKIHLNWALFKKELAENAARGVCNIVLCQNTGEEHRLEDILDDLRVMDAGRPATGIAAVSEGFASEPLRLAVWSYSDLTGTRTFVRKLPKFKMGRAFDALSEIRLGDYVVHEQFGIGRYRGLEKVNLRVRSPRSKTDIEKISEFLVLEYKAGDRLLVPVQEFRLIQKYVGQDGKKPTLYSLDGAAWERIKQKTKKEIQEMAQELLHTAALRSSIVRTTASGSQRNLLQEFADAFPYEETSDQKAAIEAVERDMECDHLMDRLVCGDVGYGKTEIAMRAAFKAVCGGKQVAVLVPTTILAEQHFKTFSNRFLSFPVKLAMLSRFQTPADVKKTVADLNEGVVDIVVGTHRLLQRDIKFKNLGLIIIDEEHRFGVKQKEALKRFKLSCDVLALSATPIPRTLSYAMGGVRDISVVETPPEGRQPIETHVGVFDEELVKAAIERELKRGGQVFYVHNRIASIEKRREVLQRLMPDLRIGLAHGQMSGEALENAMHNFLHKKWDVLLSTSIIESGLDIPSVNTLIVEDSEEFGLAQLYQLRGRVGRQRAKAYCYLFFSGWTHLSEDARKRLDAIQEFSSLGSGMKLAMRDLEIRGTGNFLGPQQHGWINAVGLELYCQLLSDELRRVKEERGIPVDLPRRGRESDVLAEIELNLPAFIPEDYVEPGGERIALYKRLSSIRTPDELDQMKSELLDLFGPIPEPVQNLLKVIDLKLAAREAKVASVSERDQGFLFSWSASDGRSPLDLGGLASAFPDSIEILPPVPGEKESRMDILYKVEDGAGADVFALLKDLLQRTRKFVIV